jgi:hypothetical protein
VGLDGVAVQYGHVCRSNIHHADWCMYLKGVRLSATWYLNLATLHCDLWWAAQQPATEQQPAQHWLSGVALHTRCCCVCACYVCRWLSLFHHRQQHRYVH